MDNALAQLLAWALSLAKAYPPAAAYIAIAVTAAGALLMAQPMLRALVEWTPTKVDNVILEVLLKIANLLTPAKASRGAKVVAKAAASDADIVANIIAKWGDASKVPGVVIETMTDEQQDLLAGAYVDAATRRDR